MKFYISIFYTIFFIISAHAGNFQSTTSIKTEIEAYFKANIPQQHLEDIEIRVENVDPRLQLKECPPESLKVFNPYSTPLMQTNTMGLRCVDDEVHWTLYVPVTIAWYKNVVVTRRAIARGRPLQPSLLGIEKKNVNQLRNGYFTDSQELKGQVTRHNLTTGTVINPALITRQKIVKRGQQVAIEAKSDHFSIRMQGKAMSDGCLGDIIQVKNITSKRTVQARVTGSNTVKVHV